jgi:hypothetical protein
MMRATHALFLLTMLFGACRGADHDESLQERTQHAEQTRQTKQATQREQRQQARPVARPVISDSAVGPVRLGLPWDSLARHATVVVDTTILDVEGHRQRIARLAVANDIVTAELADGRVWRLRVTSPRLATADGIRVGSPVSLLLTSDSVVGALGEGRVYVLTPRHCGLSFRIASNAESPRTELDSAALARLPSETRVDEILVVGCG